MVGDGGNGSAGFGAFLVKTIDWYAVVVAPSKFDAESGGWSGDVGNYEVKCAVEITGVIGVCCGGAVMRKNTLML